MTLQANYANAVAAAKIESALSPATLTSLKERVLARARLKDMDRAIDSWEAGTADYTRVMLEELDTLGLSPSAKKQVLSSFQQTTDARREQAQEWIKIQRDVVNRITDILDLAESIEPPLRVENGVLAFQTQEQLDRYNGLLESVRVLGTREEELLDANLKANQAMNEQLKNEIKESL